MLRANIRVVRIESVVPLHKYTQLLRRVFFLSETYGMLLFYHVPYLCFYKQQEQWFRQTHPCGVYTHKVSTAPSNFKIFVGKSTDKIDTKLHLHPTNFDFYSLPFFNWKSWRKPWVRAHADGML